MKPVETKKGSTKYKLVLTQSEKKIQTQHRLSVQTEFRQRSSQTLRLNKGSSFWSLQDDFWSIYDNFNLPSYFSSTCQVRICSRIYGEPERNFIKADIVTFKFTDKTYLFIEKSKDPKQFKIDKKQQVLVLPTERKPLRIFYQICELPENTKKDENDVEIQITKNYIESQNKTNVVVQFVTKIEQEYDENSLLCHVNKKSPQVQVFDKHREIINITVTDQEQVLKDLSLWNRKQYGHRISEIRKSKIKQIEYFYKEPENQRFRYINGKHLSLALQGGGCKGVQYVGAYQAILEAKKKITSVIGSSAGSILGLAIGLNLKPQQIIKLCETKLSKVAEDQKFRTLDEEQKHFMRKTCSQVIDFLQKLNIFDSHITSSFVKCFEDEQFKQILLKLIKAVTNPEIHKLFVDHRSKDLNLLGLLNGSLMGGNIIKEIAVNCIYLYFLNDQEQKSKIKLFKRFPELEKRAGKESDLYNIAENMNMKELYELTGVQFTCTAVDIDNQILRFLNQKTTPDLPVCKAVQMSGSFPVAFEAQKWQKSWGKYYIHYDNIRREIDLTGCRLTDGGTLANFPVKYLDNQDMRPMYFSHAKDTNTEMYGIGLITDIAKQKKKQEEIETALNELKQRAMKIIGVLEPLCSWIISKFTFCKCQQPKQLTVKIGKNPFEAFTKIPIVQFLLKLLQTYSSMKLLCGLATKNKQGIDQTRNQFLITYKDFLHNFKEHQEMIQVLKRKRILSKKFIKHLQLIQGFWPHVLLLCEAGKIIYYNISTFLVSLINHYELKNEKIDQMKKQTRKRILQALREHLRNYFSNHHSQAKVLKKNLLRAFLSKIKEVGDKKLFVLCQVKEDFEELNVMVETTISFCERLKVRGDTTILAESLLKIRDKETKQIKMIIQNLQVYWKERLKNGMINKKVAQSLFKLNELTITKPYSLIKQAKSLIQQSEVPDFFIYEQADRHRDLIKAYTLDRIHDYYNKNAGYSDEAQPPNGLHLVLESVSLSELYFHQYFLIVKDMLLQYNTQYKKMIESHTLANQKSKKSVASNKCSQDLQWDDEQLEQEEQTDQKFPQQEANQLDFIDDVQKKMKGYLQVTTMTATGYHSLAIFLHASDLGERRIGQEIWRIRQLIKLEKEDEQALKNKYENADWSKVTPILLREIQKKAIQKKKDIFEYIEEELLANEAQCKREINKLKSSLENQIRKIKLENEEMTTVVETSLSYIVNMLLEIEATGMQPDKIYETLQEKLFLRQAMQINADNMRKEESERIRNVFQFFYEKYSDIIKYIALSTPFVIDQTMKIMRPEERKQAWKGLILSQFLSTNRIKAYVQQILTELKLSPHATLKQFYDASSKKIQLNFSVIEDNIVAIYNHKTRPSMPVWAAIVAATSIPEFFPPLLDLPEWGLKQLQDYKERKVKSYFSKPKNPYVFITSSEALTRLPMDLLQNNKFRDNITDNKNEVFLMFNFSELKFKTIFENPVEEFKVKSLTLGQCISKFVSFRQAFYGKVGKTLKKQEYDNQMKNANALKMLSHLPIVQAKSKLLNLYVESHDNLIIKLYERELVQMPIRFSTLDFHVMTQQKKFLGTNSKPIVEQRLSDICQDAIMQAQYILTEKMTNRHIIQEQNRKKKKFKSSKKIIAVSEAQIIRQKIKSKKEQNSQRFIYFRVQSKLPQRARQARDEPDANGGRKQIARRVEVGGWETANSFNVKPSSIIYPESETSGMDLTGFKEYEDTQNVLSFRFLSMLNPSQELYERYHLYYRFPFLKQQRKNIPNSLLQGFVKIKTERLEVPFEECKKTGLFCLQLKVEYPSPDLREVKTKYFIMDLNHLFELNRNLIQKNKCNRFGFIYRLEFDKIYGHDQNYKVLHPLDCYETDYLNMNTDLQKRVPQIMIKSNLEWMPEKASRCEQCIAPLKKRRNNEGKGQLYCESEMCRMSDLVVNRFRIKYDNSVFMLKCSQGHELVRTQSTDQNHRRLKYEKCDICGDSCIDYMWEDRECLIGICDECKSKSLDLCNDNY